MATHTTYKPLLSLELVARILSKLGISDRPTLDLDGLNRVIAAYCSNVPNDNIQKRIWLVGDQSSPVTGGDPIEFFESWLTHGTGGTCFPTNGALCVLLRAIGFNANRISGSILMEGIEQDGNHGSVLVNLEGIEYLVDAQLASFKALPLVQDQSASTGDGIHDICAVPFIGGFDVRCFPGSNRTTPLIMRPDLKRGPVDHQYFLTHYDLSALRDRKRSPFNDSIFASRRSPDSILIVGRGNRIHVSANNTVTKTEITDTERAQVLIVEMGFSEEIVKAIPPDEIAGV